MAYDEGLAQRIREMMDSGAPYTEKKMFGGLSFLINGNMSVGVSTRGFMVRVGKQNDEDARTQPHTHQMDFTGKVMKGWVMVSELGYESDEDLQAWIKRGVDFALSLPSK